MDQADVSRGRRVGLCYSHKHVLSADMLQFSAVSLFPSLGISSLSLPVLIPPCPRAPDDCVPIVLSTPAFVPFLIRCCAALLTSPEFSYLLKSLDRGSTARLHYGKGFFGVRATKGHS